VQLLEARRGVLTDVGASREWSIGSVTGCGRCRAPSCLITEILRSAASAVRFLPLRIVDGADTIDASGNDDVVVVSDTEKATEEGDASDDTDNEAVEAAMGDREAQEPGGSKDIEDFCMLRRVTGAEGESLLSKKAATASDSRAGTAIRSLFDRRLGFVLVVQEMSDGAEAAFTAESETNVASVRARTLRAEELLAAGRVF
jgi:hypothetical protein